MSKVKELTAQEARNNLEAYKKKIQPYIDRKKEKKKEKAEKLTKRAINRINRSIAYNSKYGYNRCIRRFNHNKDALYDIIEYYEKLGYGISWCPDETFWLGIRKMIIEISW